MNFGLSVHLLSALALDVSLLVERQQFSKSEEIVLVILLTLSNRTLNRLGFGMLKFHVSSSRDRLLSLYPVKYCLESVDP